jgi:outer membrane receptor protein involved in Fe transport
MQSSPLPTPLQPRGDFQCLPRALALIAIASALPAVALAEGAGFDEEITVVAPTPAALGLGLAVDRLPFAIQSGDADALERAQSLDLTDYLTQNLGSVSANIAQNNPLQPDVQFRGYSASPLLGLPMGLSVYQNGVRVNEPLGDAVNWDLLPESAVQSISLVGGANPLYGLNTLGGALTIRMKDGFSYQGHGGEVSGGSFDRVTTTAESGGNNGSFGYYANVSYFDEEGWRDLSPSDALNLYGSVSWRAERSGANLSYQYADTNLTGNGASPVGLIAQDRESIFTAPDITDNRLHAVTFDATHNLSDVLSVGANGFYRNLRTSSFNGDGSEFVECGLGSGNFLIEELDEDAVEALGVDDDDICDGNALNASDPEDLENILNGLAGDPEAFNVEDISAELSGTGILSDEAINNRSTRAQETYGSDVQLTFTQPLFNRDNYLVVGGSFFKGEADFDANVELARLDPVTRSTAGLGVGSFVDEYATSVKTATRTWSFYFMDNLALTDSFTVTFGGRYNDTDIRLRDRSGERRELNGDHNFSRFNPTVGATWAVTDEATLYSSYSESSRAPTPIELACNEGVFEVARRIAIEDGEDPDDIEFECRLPNAFLADPPLDQVVAKGVEAGLRGMLGERVEYRLGYFRTTNHDDIIFQSTGRNTGLFDNVDKTRRQGMELGLAGDLHGVDWFTAYSYISATFESPFSVLSPNHPDADAAGELAVRPGDRVPGIPRHQLKVGGDYTLPLGVRLGLEVLYNSDQVLRGDEANLLETVDGYAIVNLRMSYRVNKRVEMFGKVNNLFDTDYESFGLIGEDPTEILPNLTNDSPNFLGVGAPIGGWVGLRVRF